MSLPLPAIMLTPDTSVPLLDHQVVGTPSSEIDRAATTKLSHYEFPSTAAQSELWIHSQFSPAANCAFNVTATLRLSGPLDEPSLRAAIDTTFARHEMLLATFSSDGQTVLIHADARYAFSRLDWSKLTTTEQDQKHAKLIRDEGDDPFDLSHGPLLRIRLVCIGPQEYWLTISAHHLALDGWSVFVFCRDLGHFYRDISTKSKKQPPTCDSYHSYSRAMHAHEESAAGQADEAFWKSQFADAIPMLDLPTDRPRPALKTFSSQRYDHIIAAAGVSVIQRGGANCGCSLFNFVLAGFHAFLGRIAGQTDFTIGIPTAGQASLGFPNLIGHCVNTIPLRAQVDFSQTVTEFATCMRGKLLDALEHQRYTFSRLVQALAPPRDPSRPTMFPVMINIDPTVDESEFGFGELRCRLIVEPRTQENFEWFISGVSHRDGSLELQCQYNTDLFDRETVAGYMEGLETFLLAMAENLHQPLSQLPVVSLRQRQQMVVQWNATQRDFSETTDLPKTLDFSQTPVFPVRTVQADFQRQASETPNRTAVSFGGVTLTYAELRDEVTRLAKLLGERGVQAGDRVGICLPRSERMLISALAIWELGATYVPLDPAYPIERLRMVCDDADLKRILVDSETRQRLPEFHALMLDLTAAREDLSRFSTEPLPACGQAADVAYMIYTSGSTGKPKGVQVPQGCVWNFLHSMQQQPGFADQDRILAITSLSFDISVLELYLPLITGGEVVIVEQAAVSDGVRLLELVKQHRITVLQSTPTTWRMLIEADWSEKLPLRALCGGEPFPRDLLAPLLSRCDEVWNMYGPTETTVWSTVCRLVDATMPISIGFPIANTQLYVLDENLKELPVGATGELFIGGAGVTLGYWNRDELTRDRFIDNPFFDPFADYINHRLYRTGDLVRRRANGNIEFVRRNDKQIKLRGHRIELGEIEQRLHAHPRLRQSLVTVCEVQTGDARLVAYFITAAGQTVTASDLREYLRESLPDYMIPQNYIELDSFPKTDNGKIDHKRLPAPIASVQQEILPPNTAREKLLAEVWQEVLDVPVLNINDNFFSLGGHSLLVMRVIARVQALTGIQLGPQDFLMGTLEQLATRLSERSVDKDTASSEESVPPRYESRDIVGGERVTDSRSPLMLDAAVSPTVLATGEDTVEGEEIEDEEVEDPYMAAVRSGIKTTPRASWWNRLLGAQSDRSI